MNIVIDANVNCKNGRNDLNGEHCEAWLIEILSAGCTGWFVGSKCVAHTRRLSEMSERVNKQCSHPYRRLQRIGDRTTHQACASPERSDAQSHD
jgi:hypothetical protein